MRPKKKSVTILMYVANTEQIFVIYFAINYNFVLVAHYYGFIRFQTGIL